jgi:sec-independent protein translocase protein TatA
MPTIGLMELVIVLVILGPKRLPSAGRSLGQGLREFRNGIAGRSDTAEVTARQDRRPDPPA